MRSESDLKGMALPAPPISKALPISGPPFERPDPALIERLRGVSSATASAMLHKMGAPHARGESGRPRRHAPVYAPAGGRRFGHGAGARREGERPLVGL
jgi:hypothetical protein